MNARIASRVAGLALAWMAGSLQLAAAEAPGPAVRMSPYEVHAYSVDFASWIKVGSPSFILYTDAKFTEASEVIMNFERLRAAAQLYFARPMRTAAPTLLVLPTSGSDWRKIASKGNVQWTVASSSPAGRVVDMVLGQYDWQRDAASVSMKSYAYTAMQRMNLDGAFWFLRGASSIFEAAEFGENSVVLGRHNERLRHLHTEGWLPWEKLFRVTPNSPEFVKEFEISRFEAQCAIIVHYCMTHPEPGWLDRLIRWVALLKAGREPTEEAFMGVFGQDWKAWQKTLAEYLRGGKYRVNTLPITPALLAATPAKLPLPVREMRELFVLCQVLNQDVPASRESLDSLLAKGLKSEALRDLLAEACLKLGRIEAAEQLLRALAAEDSPNPEVHAAAAMLRVARALGATSPEAAQALAKPGLRTRLGSDADEVRASARRALELDPRHPAASGLLAFVEAFGPAIGPANVAAIEAIYRRVAGDSPTSDVVTALAVARWRLGDATRARLLAETLQSSPFADEDARNLSKELLAALDASVKP